MSEGRKPLRVDDIPTLELESTDPGASTQSEPVVNVQACYPNACPPNTGDNLWCQFSNE